MNDFLRYLRGLFFLLIVSGVFMTLGCSETEAQKKTNHQSAPSYDYKGKLPALATSEGVYALKLPKQVRVKLYKADFDEKRGFLPFIKLNHVRELIGEKAQFSLHIPQRNIDVAVSLYSDRTHPSFYSGRTETPFYFDRPHPSSKINNVELLNLQIWDVISRKELEKLSCQSENYSGFCDIAPAMHKKFGVYWHSSFAVRGRFQPALLIPAPTFFYYLPHTDNHTLAGILGRCGYLQELHRHSGFKPKNKLPTKCSFMGYLKENLLFSLKFNSQTGPEKYDHKKRHSEERQLLENISKQLARYVVKVAQ